VTEVPGPSGALRVKDSNTARDLIRYNPRVLHWPGAGGIPPEGAWGEGPVPTVASLLLEGLRADEVQGIAAAAASLKAPLRFRRVAPDRVRLEGDPDVLLSLAEHLGTDREGGTAVGPALREVLHACRRPRRLRLRGETLDLDRRVALMGILNVTPDSFSDGGRFLEPGRAVEHGLAMHAEGADIIDVGGESTRPGAAPVPPGEQIRRIGPVVARLAAEGVPVSIDTTSAQVAGAALDRGACLVNDVTALRSDPAMRRLVAERGVPVVLMHMQGDPRTMQVNPTYRDVTADVLRFLRERVLAAVAAGVGEGDIVVDPGIGFGKTVEHNLTLIRRVGELRGLGQPVLLGASRKSFIGKALGVSVEQRLAGSLAVAAWSVASGVNVLRVHDVRETAEVVGLMQAVLESAA